MRRKIDGEPAVDMVIARDLPYPGGVVVTKSGEIYMTLYSIFPGMGMVVRM